MFQSSTRTAVIVLGGLLTISRSASAESEADPPSCEVQPSPAIAQGVTVPANLPAIPIGKRFVEGGKGVLSVRSASSGTFVVEDDPRSELFFLLRPQAPLPAGGAVTIELNLACRSSRPGEEATATAPAPFTVHAVAERPLPQSLGSVQIDPARTYARITLSEEMIPFVTTLGIATLLDRGNGSIEALDFPLYYSMSVLAREILVGTSPYGSRVPGYDANVVHQHVLSDVALASTVCGDARSGTKDYSLRVQGHIAGAAADPPPLVIPLAVSCGKALPAPTASAPTASTPNTSDSGDGGCTLSAPRRTDRLPCALSLATLIALILSRRRRV